MSAEEFPGSEAKTGRKTARDLFPYTEDWIALQGGRPRVFRNPRRPSSVWVILHVYEEHGDAKNRFQSGALVQTLPPEGGKFKLSRMDLERRNDDGQIVEREFMIPSFMNRHVHGDACGTRSGSQGGGDYERVKGQERYEEVIREYTEKGWEELRFSVTPDGESFALNPLPHIRPPKPLQPRPAQSS